MKTETLAAIDIGSNAIRLLIYNVDTNGLSVDFKKAAFLRVPIRLGEDVFTKRCISVEKQEMMMNAMYAFSYSMKVYGVDRYRACATSAMRDASNGVEIVELIRKNSGIHIEIINGQEEADIIFEAGGLEKVMDKNRNYLYVDVGGGSTEVVLFNNQQKILTRSFQLGTVRILSDAVDEGEFDELRKWLKKFYKDYFPLSIIGSGGNINKIHKLLGKKENEYISYPEIRVFYETMKDMTYDERILNYKLKNYRADVIIPAMKIFNIICKTCKINEIYVPKVGLADGIIHHLYHENIDAV
jgi:exopolyphosphatase / guanosine-5'-triphosphate,3'-diphosphate pyrophosphatase